MVDWLNPTQEMLEGLHAGRQERQNEIGELESEIGRLGELLDLYRKQRVVSGISGHGRDVHLLNIVDEQIKTGDPDINKFSFDDIWQEVMG